jgi:AraC-like DNA-binding protein
VCASVYGAAVDAVGALLDGPRARSAFLLRSTLAPPWAIRVEDEAPLTVVAVVRGAAHLLPDTGEPALLVPGDVAVVCGPGAYTVADDPGTPPDVVVLPGQVCRTPAGQELGTITSTGPRSWGNRADGGTVLLTGTYQHVGEVSSRLLAALPALLVLPGAGRSDPLLGHLCAELDRDEPGQQALLDRLLDVLLIGALRAWFARPEARAPGWYLAHSDPVVGPALRLLHDDPAAPWTVASLASAVGISRAALARRFGELVGEPPMAYLTSWRLALAADLLAEPGATVGAVAGKVGYGSSYALSTAFRRVRGVSPSGHRAGLTAAPAGPGC